MAINFKKKSGEEASPAKSKSKPKTPSNVSYLKKGNAAKAAVETEKQKAVAREAEKGQVRRFWIPKDAETIITFLDGELDEDGFLDVPMFYEHQLYMNDNWRNWFVCTKNVDETEPCPICESTGKAPYLVGLLSIIDHSVYEANDGTVYKDQIRLFAAKQATLNKLTKKAKKFEGLTGASFEVSRTGDKSASVGDDFDYNSKHTLKELAEEYPDTSVQALNYTEVVPYRDAEELRAEFGFGTKGVGSESGGKYSDEL